MRRPSLRLVMIAIFGLTSVLFFTLSNALTSHFVNRTFETELRNYAESQTLVFAMMVEQDLMNGFFPAIAQKAEKLLARDEILRIQVAQADGSVVLDSQKPDFDAKVQSSFKIVEPVGVAAEADAKVSTVTIWHDGTRFQEALARMKTLIAYVGVGVLFGLFVIILFASTSLARPLIRLRQIATSGDLAQIASMTPLSRIAEIRDLENQLKSLGRQVLDQVQVREENAKLQAMARTTQMLAHDVRRPFSKLKIAVQMLLRAKEQGDVEGAAERVVADVERDIAAVNGLIQDIMEFGAAGALHLEKASPREILRDAVAEICHIRRPSGQSFQYELEHSRRLDVDVGKVRRVFSNIIDNAVHAAAAGGKLWFRTRDVQAEGTGRAMVEFTVGNGGAAISPADVDKVFQAFFTKNKPGGTGLGLAIAQKIVAQHEGRIACRSVAGFGTEFVLTLPAAAERDEATVALPERSERVFEAGATRRLSRRTGRPLIAVLEDDPFIAAAWAESLAHAFDVLTFEKPSIFWQAVKSRQIAPEEFLCVVTDFYFPEGEEDGLAFAKQFLDRWRVPVCLSTDADVPDQSLKGLARRIGKLPLTPEKLREVILLPV